MLAILTGGKRYFQETEIYWLGERDISGNEGYTDWGKRDISENKGFTDIIGEPGLYPEIRVILTGEKGYIRKPGTY